MTTKLNDAQLLMMRAAAQREDGCLTAADDAKRQALAKLSSKLVDLVLAREVRAKGDIPVWRRDDGVARFALKLTAAGLKAIAVEEEGPVDTVVNVAPPARLESPEALETPETDAAAPGATPTDRTDRSEPRGGSKLAIAIGLLRRANGATIAELTAATGWLPHTMRAALTGLRKRNFSVTREIGGPQGLIYGIASLVAPPPAIAVAAPETKASRITPAATLRKTQTSSKLTNSKPSGSNPCPSRPSRPQARRAT